MRKGFTLIELLVVIFIIGLLASIVVVSVQAARTKARDAKRVADLKQIQNALESYNNANNQYPNPGWAWRSECAAWGGYAANNVIPGLVPTYLSAFPSDPAMNKAANTSCYLYLSNGTDYAVLDHNAPEANYLTQPTLIDPQRDGGTDPCKIDGTSPWAWKVSSSGGYCW